MSFFWGRGLGVVLSFWLVLTTPVTVLRVAGQSAGVPAVGGNSRREGRASTRLAASSKPLEIVVLRRVDEADRPPTAEEVVDFLEPKPPGKSLVKYSTVLARQALAFRAGVALLRRSGVGFEPYQLLGGEWYPRLRAQIEREASFRSVQRLGERVQGVWMGDLVVVPERVEATGDVVIIARQMVVEGAKVTFKGHHHIYLFQAEPPRFTGASRGEVVIDTSGFGREAWLEAVRQGQCANPTVCDGLPGADGAPGRRGQDGNPGTKGQDGVSGTCDNINTIDGQHGEAGGPGEKGGTGEIGEVGNRGGDGYDCTCDIPTNDTATYVFISRGGDGGNGGRGGDGGNGGRGGDGGNGGAGAGCSCQYGRGGNGGDAGSAGAGGDAGDGGDGGRGGEGGRGGRITWTYCGYLPPHLVNVNGGRGGMGGGAGSAGYFPGKRGEHGKPGKGYSSFGCSGRNGRPVLLPPRNGAYGSHGRNGEIGTRGPDGDYTYHARPGCSGSGSGGSPAPPPIYQCFSFCYYVSFDGGQSWQLISCEYAGCHWVIVQ